MADKEYTLTDMVGFAAGSNAADFQAALDQILTARVSDAIEARRAEVADTFITQEEEPETEEEATDEDSPTDPEDA